MSRLSDWLAHPLTRGLDLDAPATTDLRRNIILQKPFLRRVYLEWYGLLAEWLADRPGPVVELGAGGGFFKQVLPRSIASEVFALDHLDLVANACALPFGQASLGGIALLDVLHHIADPGAFFREAERCLRPGGVVVMIEPWVSPWASLVWSRLHHEPFAPDAPDWRIPSTGPLTGANSALPWIIFQRDRERFVREYPGLRPACLRPFMPMAYLASGGVSLRLSLPGWCYGPLRRLERGLEAVTDACNCFAVIAVERV